MLEFVLDLGVGDLRAVVTVRGGWVVQTLLRRSQMVSCSTTGALVGARDFLVFGVRWSGYGLFSPEALVF